MRWLLLTAGLLAAGAVSAQGKALHDSACLQCHASLTGGNPNSLYTRAERTVSSLSALSKRVQYCERAADVQWSEQQRQQVVDYLAQQFYRF